MDVLVEKIKKKMLEGIKEKVFPGAVYAIIYKEKILTIEAVGNKSLYPKKEVNTIDTIYDLASFTKVIVTNTLISKLYEEKRINLMDKVKKYIPEFKHDDITIFDLLTHSSGLPAFVNWEGIKTKEEYINLIFKVDKEVFRHTKVIYSDIGFILLGILIEKVTGETLDELAQKEIFEKLGMDNTMFNPIDKKRCAPTEKEGDIYIKGVVHDKKARLFNGVAGHAGLFSTIFDVMNFALMVKNDGKFGGKQFISKKIIDLWYKPFFKDDDGRFRTLGGWLYGPTSQVCDKISKKALFQQGFTGSRMIIDKENDLIIIMLTNRVHPTRENKKLGPFWKNFATFVYHELIAEKVK
ncbi:MAG: serine hydrolase [Mollicutes bacterium]|nr:serine hydrolase [Mollicutes bacterium]